MTILPISHPVGICKAQTNSQKTTSVLKNTVHDISIVHRNNTNCWYFSLELPQSHSQMYIYLGKKMPALPQATGLL